VAARPRRRALRLTLEVLEDRLTPNAGSLDESFGSFGRAYTDFAGTGAATAVAVQQNDDKIVVAGSAGGSDFALARYNPDGTLDPSFNSDGKVLTDFFGRVDGANAVAIQGDGKIVAAGVAYKGDHGMFALARYDACGSLDQSFGKHGLVVTDFGGYSFVRALAIQGDGKIVAAGYAESPPGHGNFALARYDPNGSPDLSFGEFGKVLTDLAGVDATTGAEALVDFRDAELYVVGTAFKDTSNEIVVARYGLNGSLDDNFGTHGVVATSLGGSSAGHAVAVQLDGRIVVGGDTQPVGDPLSHMVLLRLRPDGTPDPGFNGNGEVVTDLNPGSAPSVRGLALQQDGRIVAVAENADAFSLARYLPDGSLDPAFGSGGTVVDTLLDPETESEAVALQPDGKIVAAGRGVFANGKESFVVERFYAFKTITISQAGDLVVVEGSQDTNHLDVSDDAHGVISVASQEERDAPFTLTGVRQLTVRTFGGDDVVRYQGGSPAAAWSPDGRPADLVVDLGAGNDHLILDAYGPGRHLPAERPWRIAVTAGQGDDRLDADVQGSVPLQMTADMGDGNDRADVILSDDTLVGSSATTIALDGGNGDDKLGVQILFPVFLGPATLAVAVLGGRGNDQLTVESADPSGDLYGLDRAQFNVTAAGGDGQDRIQVRVGNFNQPPDPDLRLDWNLVVTGDGGNDTIDVVARNVLVAAGLDGSMPVAFRLLAGGDDGNDVVSANLFFDPRSNARVDAQVLGGMGNDDLTLNIYGLDPDWISALIDGGPGHNKAHHTDNVRVINCEG
jgi:uncharacterized delta-60 repeat protein